MSTNFPNFGAKKKEKDLKRGIYVSLNLIWEGTWCLQTFTLLLQFYEKL